MTERATEPVAEKAGETGTDRGAEQVTSAATGQTDPQSATAAASATALLGEAMAKSGLLWIEVADDRTWPAWHVWDDGAALVVSGPGEQPLPWLPKEVRVILRSKDTGGRLLTVRAHVHVLEPGTPEWQRAAEPAPRVAAQLGRRLADPLGSGVHRHRARALRQPARVARRVCRPRPPRAPGPHRRDDDVVAPVALGRAR